MNGIANECYFKLVSAIQLDDLGTGILSGVVSLLVIVVALYAARMSLFLKDNHGFFYLVLFATLDNATDLLYILNELFFSEILFWAAVATMLLSVVSYVAWLIRAGPELTTFFDDKFKTVLLRLLVLLCGFLLHLLFLLGIQSVKHRFLAFLGKRRDIEVKPLEIELAENNKHLWALDILGINWDRLFLFSRDIAQFGIQLRNTTLTEQYSVLAIVSIAASGLNLTNFLWNLARSMYHNQAYFESRPSGFELTTCV